MGNKGSHSQFGVDKERAVSVLHLNVKISIYWQDFRLVIRWEIISLFITSLLLTIHFTFQFFAKYSESSIDI